MATKKTLDESGLLYFGKEYFKKLQGKFVALEEGKALSSEDFTAAEKSKLAAIEAEADVNVIESVKVNDSALTPDSNKAVNITVTEGATNGTISVNGLDVNVHGLGSAAYTASTAYDAAGAAAAVLGTAQDASTANTVYGVKAKLEEALGANGSVPTQIAAAIADLDASVTGQATGTPAASGTMVAKDVQVVETDGVITSVVITPVEVEAAGAALAAENAAKAYADGLASNYDAAGAAAAVLGDSNDTASENTVYGVRAALEDALGVGGSVPTQIQSAINALDATDAAVANQFVTSVSEEDGVITVTRAQPSAANISVAALDGIAAGDLQTVLGALEDAIDDGGTNAIVDVEKQNTAESGYAATYVVKQGGSQVGVKINIPKDFLVKSASVETVATADTPYAGALVGDKYIDFVVNTTDASETAQHIYLPVNDLVDVYTAGNGIAISSANVVSAVVDNTSESFLTVGASGLKLSGVQTAINAAEANAKAYADTKVAALDADLDASGTATDATNGVFVVSGVTEVDGVLTAVDSVEVDRAGAATAAENAAKAFTTAEIGKLDADLDASGTAQHAGTFVVSGVTEVDGKLTAVDSVEVEAAGAAAAAQAAAAADATSKAQAAQAAAEAYADSIVTAMSVQAAVASGSENYVTASASDKTVTVGVTAGTKASLALADSAIQSISDVDGTYVSLAVTTDANDASARIITVTDTAIGTALSGKADKVSGATSGNLAALDSNGNLTDSGYSATSLIQYMDNTDIQNIVDTCFVPAQQQGS